MRCIKFAFFFGSVNREFFKEVFINTADKVFFFAKRFMADFIYFIDNLFYIIRRQITGGKCTLNKAAAKLIAACGNAVQRCIKSNIQLRRRCVYNG